MNGINWIKNNKKHLSIRGINDTLHKTEGMPLETLVKAVSGARNLPKKWIKPLNNFVIKLKES